MFDTDAVSLQVSHGRILQRQDLAEYMLQKRLAVSVDQSHVELKHQHFRNVIGPGKVHGSSFFMSGTSLWSSNGAVSTMG